MQQILTLTAPLSGWITPITQVSDPVFAQKMVGDGISVDPTDNILCAPCDGTITQLHSAHHAITLTHSSGVEVLVHIGLDTVSLKGQGFTPHVRVGDYVTQGTALISFDIDYIATHARSLLTQIVITNGELISDYAPNEGFAQVKETPILTLTFKKSVQTAEVYVKSPTIHSQALTISNPLGLHARPAALFALQAKKFQADIRIQRGDQDANAKSVVSIMALEVAFSDTVYIHATGSDAQNALDTLSALIKEGLGEIPAHGHEMATSETVLPPPELENIHMMNGISASNGLAVGQILQWRHSDISVIEIGSGIEIEKIALEEAIQKAKLGIAHLREEVEDNTDGGQAAIFAAHQEILDDPDLIHGTLTLISHGKSAAFAWKQTVADQVERLSRLKSAIIAARANDVYDVGRRVLLILTGNQQQTIYLPEQTILVAEDLIPSDTISLDRTKVLGFCTTKGGTTSHVAILARALAIPTIVGIDPRALDIPDGTPAILDGTKATLMLHPDKNMVQTILRQQKTQLAQYEADLAVAKNPAQTKDGYTIEVAANISGEMETEQSIALGGEGIGLLRSEFLFLQRTTMPSEEEQSRVYTSIAQTLGPDRIMVIRTLDIGGDKPLNYLPQPVEDNPFLGVRGLRLCLDQPEILRTQIRAILYAAPFTKLHIMFPMVTTLEELRTAKLMVEQEKMNLGNPEIKIGIMVEVPATAIMAKHFAQEVDFFSIGTNDLTQYTLAMDRGNVKLAKQTDGFNPAVLQLIAQTIEGAHEYGKWVGICGSLASDPLAMPLLVGLGIDELSVSVPAIPAIKAEIRRLDRKHCQEIAKKALTFGTAEEVRTYLAKAIS